MANNWYAPLVAALGGVTPTSAAPTTRPPTSAVVTSRVPTSAVVTSRAPTSAVVTSRAPTSAPVTTRPASSPVPTTSGAPTGSCSATYKIVGSWPGGFQGEVTVKAGSSAISKWTTSWTYANGQTITQSWSSTLTSSGATVTASNAAWNGSLAADASTTFGFIGTWNGTNPVPTVTCA
ncbi:cellulose binding domain-containing protein [Luedemannella flava]